MADNLDPAILDWLASCNKDPERFVMTAFPWGDPETSLAAFDGPNDWQRWVLSLLAAGLLTIDEAIQIAVASGHGVGKSALVSWIILWGFATAPDTRGVVTANTATQLATKTWAELGKWFNLFIAREHFELSATSIRSRDPSRVQTWRIDAVPWSEKSTEAFAGLHNQGKRLLLVMDEASAIPDAIWEVAEGALTDANTEIIWLAFGNPTRNSGRFRECFPGGAHASAWRTRAVDARSIPFTNHKKIATWEETYGEDSDFFRIRVKGEFPRQGMMEFFTSSDIDAAMTREIIISRTDPLALGVDVARFGQNNSVIFPRKGRDARTIEREVFSRISTTELATRVFSTHQRLNSDGIFIDGGGVGGGVVDNCRQSHLFVHEVQFGAKDDVGGAPWGISGERYANKRAAMYGAARAWLRTGAIPNDPELKKAMLAIKYTFNKKDEIILEAKEDIMAENPDIILDDLDALVLTFAQPLAAHTGAGGDFPRTDPVEHEYDPFSSDRMVA